MQFTFFSANKWRKKNAYSNFMQLLVHIPGVCVYLWGKPSSWTVTFNFSTLSSNVWSHWWKSSLLLCACIRHRFLFPCSLRSAFFWVVTHRIMIVLYRPFGTSLFHLHGSRNPRSNLSPLTHYCNVWRLANWAQCICVCRMCSYLFNSCTSGCPTC